MKSGVHWNGYKLNLLKLSVFFKKIAWKKYLVKYTRSKMKSVVGLLQNRV